MYGALRGAEDDASVRADVGDRAVRAEGAVSLVGAEIARRHGLRRAGERRRRRCPVLIGTLVACRFAGFRSAALRLPFPDSFERRRPRSTFSSAAAWIASHSSGATTPRKFPTWTTCTFGMCATELLSTLSDGRALGQRGLPARAHDAAVEHPGHPHVLDVGRLPGDDRRDVDPRHRRPISLYAAGRRERRV